MTLRTISATRRTVVSRSRDVAKASATSSNNDSTGNRCGFDKTDPIGVTSYDNSRLSSSRCAKLFARDNADIGEIAVFLGIVEAVSNHEFVGNFKTHVVALEGKLAARRLIAQRGALDRSWLVCEQQSLQTCQGK